MSSVLPFIVGVLIFVVGLAVSIALHELGHLTAAKAFGVRVTQYMIGFGKTLFSFRKGETEYGVKLLPLGGYIAMIGMFPPAHPGEAPRDASTGFYNSIVTTDGGIGAPREQRGAVGASGMLKTMAAEARQASAETIPEGQEHRAFYLLHPFKRIIVMFAGPFMNLVIAFVLIAIMLCGIGVQTPSTTVQSVSECLKAATSTSTTCGASDPASPAASAGFEAGDRIVSYDGTAITDWDQLQSKIQKSADETVPVVVERDGRQVTLHVTPQATQTQVTNSAGTTTTETVGMIGVTPTTPFQPQPIGTAFTATGENLGQVAGVFINLPQRMVGIWNAAFGSQERAANSPVGIIGVGRMAGEIADSSGYAFASKIQLMLSLLASLNLALFVFNMVPLLPLDGGHIIGAVWEWIKRGWFKATKRAASPKPVDMARLMPVTYAVIIVLGAMSLLLAYADIVKPISLPG